MLCGSVWPPLLDGRCREDFEMIAGPSHPERAALRLHELAERIRQQQAALIVERGFMKTSGWFHTGIVTQRRVGKRCSNCRVSNHHPTSEKSFLAHPDAKCSAAAPPVFNLCCLRQSQGVMGSESAQRPRWLARRIGFELFERVVIARIAPVPPGEAYPHQFLIAIGQRHFSDGAAIAVDVAHIETHKLSEGEIACELLRTSAEGLAGLGTIDTVKPDAYRCTIMKHADRVAVGDGDDLSLIAPADGIGSHARLSADQCGDRQTGRRGIVLEPGAAMSPAMSAASVPIRYRRPIML